MLQLITPSTELNRPFAPVRLVNADVIGLNVLCIATLASSKVDNNTANTPPPLPTLKKFLIGANTFVFKLILIPPNGPF